MPIPISPLPLSLLATAPQDVPPGMLPAGRRLIIKSRVTNHNIRMHPNGSVDAMGHEMPPAQWTISPSATGFLRLQNVAHPQHYLAIRGGQVTFGESGKSFGGWGRVPRKVSLPFGFLKARAARSVS